MNNVYRLTQAYSQAPWRKQLQMIGMFLLVLIAVALVAGIYLNVSARSATVGRSIQSMQADIEVRERNIADLESELAYVVSHDVMQKRAEALGFESVDLEEALYVPVSSFPDRQPAQLAPAFTGFPEPAKVISPAFTESLFDLLRERVFEPAAPLLEINR